MMETLQLLTSKLLHPLRPIICPLLNLPSKARLRNVINIMDLRACAQKRLHPVAFANVDACSDDEVTKERNKSIFNDYEFHFKVLQGNKDPIDLSTEVMGHQVDLPFFCCPTALNRLFHHEGEKAVAKVSHENKSLYCLSSMASSSFEEINVELGGINSPRAFQLYAWKDKKMIKELLVRAKKQGFTSLIMTVDLTWFGNREACQRLSPTIPPKATPSVVFDGIKYLPWSWDYMSTKPIGMSLIPGFGTLGEFFGSGAFDQSFNWDDIQWLRDNWEGTMALKGVVRPDIAEKAVEMGIDTIWISNHGARQLDGSVPALAVLADIKAAVDRKVKEMAVNNPQCNKVNNVCIIVDGGITRGTDIIKALALGADGVGLGKAYIYGLSAGGSDGLATAFRILRKEMQVGLGLLGVGSVEELKKQGRGLVKKRGI